MGTTPKGWKELIENGPVPKDHPLYGRWVEALRSIQENNFKALSKVSGSLPPKNASTETFQNWFVELWTAQFDAAAEVFADSIKDYGGADSCEKLLEELAKAMYISGENLCPRFIPKQTFLPELKIRVGQRHLYWAGLAFQRAREAEQRRKTTKPASQGGQAAEQPFQQEDVKPVVTPTSEGFGSATPEDHGGRQPTTEENGRHSRSGLADGPDSTAAKPERAPEPHPQDPVENNPVPEGHPAHKVWEDATQEALEEIYRLNERMLGSQRPSPTGLPFWTIELVVSKYQIWARRNLCVVRNANDARGYEQWLDNYMQAWIDSSGGRFPDFLPEFKAQLLRACNYWKGNAWAQVQKWSARARESELARDQIEAPATAQRDTAAEENSDSASAEGDGRHSAFASEAGRINAIAAYTKRWTTASGTCTQGGSLARTARVDPADLSKWKKGLLPSGSDKARRIEDALTGNTPPTPVTRRNSDV